jgi:hypothetical protein
MPSSIVARSCILTVIFRAEESSLEHPRWTDEKVSVESSFVIPKPVQSSKAGRLDFGKLYSQKRTCSSRTASQPVESNPSAPALTRTAAAGTLFSLRSKLEIRFRGYMPRIQRIFGTRGKRSSRRTGSIGSRPFYRRALAVEEAAALCATIGFWLTGSRLLPMDRFGYRGDLAAVVASLGFIGFILAVVVRRTSSVLSEPGVRGEYDEQRILIDLGQAARAVTTVEHLFKLVVEKIGEALGAESVFIFVRDDRSGDYVCEMSSPNNGPNNGGSSAMLARNALVVKRIKNLGIPLAVDPGDFAAWRMQDAAGDKLETIVAGHDEGRADRPDLNRSTSQRTAVFSR